ncbi:DMT family transporter [Silvanigrella aquatica]|uniref:EamA domain-containing protein n=1 Tax=Silvanigrella aquatica TaxID=1915309 RepID=A0A1L4D463_9BACT|nr:DMT family transporter [Silvanigrella aquatica]APJ04970.1 hypothetical protein AXG55_14140 [Silvanigrella aquatica]
MSKNLSIILLVLTTFFWGTNFNIGKFVVDYMHPTAAAAWRFAIATLLILIIVIIKKVKLKKSIKTNYKIYIVLGIIGIAGFNELFFWGMKYTTPLNGALIMATNPILSSFFSYIILKDPIKISQKIGMILSLFGVVIVVTNGSLLTLKNLEVAIGDWIIILGNFCWALYGVLGRKYLKNSEPLVTTVMTMLVGTIFLFILAIPNFSWIEISTLPLNVYGALIFMAIFGSALAYLFWNFGIEKLGVPKTVVFFNLVPVFTVLTSLVMGHPLAISAILGGVVVILGVLISSDYFNFMSKMSQKEKVKKNSRK